MSRLISLSLAIKDRLETIPGLEDCVVVFTRKNIASEFTKRMGTIKGKIVIVRLISARNVSKQKLIARYSGTYSVSLIMEPALTELDAQSTDLIIEAIADSLHGYWPESIPSPTGLFWMEAGDITFPEDPDYQVAVLTVTAPRQTD